MIFDLGGNILPAFAEGTKGIKACSERLAVLYSAGVDAAVLTPRYYPAKRSIEDFVAFRKNVLHTLSYNMPENCPALYLGCEVYIDERLKYISKIDELTVWGTRTMIAYMPEGEWNAPLFDTIEAIRAVGIEVLIAHIDRYNDRYAESIFKYGYRAIIDVSAFVGFSNLWRRKKYLSWIDQGYVIGIGSNYEVKKRRIANFIFKTANCVGLQLNEKTNEKKRISRIIAKAVKVIGEERLGKLAESSARVLTGAVNLTK